MTDIVLLSDLKEMLGLPEEDNTPDRKLTLILDGTKKRLKFLLGGLDLSLIHI